MRCRPRGSSTTRKRSSTTPTSTPCLVASSDQTHEALVLACIAAGKPVLCEKPLAPTVAGCRHILDAEAAAGRRLVSVGFMRRYDPGYVELKRLLDDGQLGLPLLLHCVHRNPAAPASVPSGHLITGSAVHEIDIARWLFGDEIATVTVHTGRSSRAAGTTRDPLLLVLETTGGVLIDVEVFVHARYGYEVRCELVGEEGTAALDAPAPTLLRRNFAAGRGPGRRLAAAVRRGLPARAAGLGRRAARDRCRVVGAGHGLGRLRGDRRRRGRGCRAGHRPTPKGRRSRA